MTQRSTPVTAEKVKTEHTPTPWRVFINTDGTKLVGIGSQDGAGILDCGFGIWSWNDPEGIANANMVVKAVNSHDHLVKALEASCGYLLNAKIDLETGCTKATAIKTIEGGLLRAEAVLAIIRQMP